MAYNAGTIFLQVVPVFKNLQDTIRSETEGMNKVLGDELEKGGKKAGERASKAIGEELGKGGKEAGHQYGGDFQESFTKSLRDLEKKLKPIKVHAETNEVRHEFAEIQKIASALKNVKIGAAFDGAEAFATLRRLQERLDAISHTTGKVDLKHNFTDMANDLDKFIAKVEKSNPELRLEIDTKPAARAMGDFETKARRSAQKAADSLADSFDRATSEAGARLRALADIDVTPEMNGAALRAEIAEISREIHAMATDETIDFEVRSDAMSAYADLLAFNELGNKLDGQHWDVTVALDATEAEREMGAFERKVRESANASQRNLSQISPTLARIKGQLADLSDPTITPELNSEHVISEMRGLAQELKAVATDTTVDVDIRTDAAAAYRDLVPLMAAFSAIDGRTLNVEVDLDTGAAVAKTGLLNQLFSSMRKNGDDGANSFRAFNAVILAGATLLPALVPALAAVGGGLLALIPILGAVGAGLGVMLAGFSGIGPVIKGFSDVQKNAGEDARIAGKRIASAAKGIADAERNLARARSSAAQANSDAARSVGRAEEQAAKQIKNALEARKEAEHNLANAQRDAREAQEGLREARQKAQEELDAAADREKQNALDVRQGVVDVFNATVKYNAVMEDGSSTNLDKEVADIGLQQARLDLEEARKQAAKDAADKKKLDAAGINGTNAMQSAQDKVTAALERQHDAEIALGKASAAVTEARVEGARAIEDALRNQQRTAAAGAQSISDAQRNLADAQSAYTDAVDQTSTSVRNLDDALSKVGPAGERFARFIYGLKDEAYGLRDAIQSAMLPGVQRGLQSIIDTYGPQFQSFAARMGGVIGKMFDEAGKGLGRRPFQEFFATYGVLAPRLMAEAGKTTGNWMGVFAKLMTIIAPYAERFSLALLRISERALAFMDSSAGTTYWTRFMDYAQRVGPMVADFFWNLWKAVVAISVALAPWGETVLKTLDGILRWIVALDPDTLSFVVTTIVGLVIALQLAVGMTALLKAGAAAFYSPASLFVFVLVALGVAAYAAYQNVGWFHDAVDRAIQFVKDNAGTLEHFAETLGVIAAAFGAYKLTMMAISGVQTAYVASMFAMDAISGKYSKTVAFLNKIAKTQLVMNWLITASLWAQNAAWLANPITWIIIAIIAAIALLVGALIYLYKHNETVRHAIDAAWAAIKSAIGAAWDFIKPILSAIGAAFVWLWKSVISPVLGWIGGLFMATFRGIAWAWSGILWPILDLLIHIIMLLWSGVVKPYLGFIWALFKAVFRGIAWAWKNVLHPVLSLMGTVISDLWKKYVSPILGWIGRKWDDMARGFGIVWNSSIKPIFDAFTEKVLPKLKSAFSTVVDAIKTIWEGLKVALAAPIRFVIEKIINGGIIAAFNWVAKKVGSTPMKEIPLPKALEAPKGKARGGSVRSASDYNVYPGYTPGKDIGFIGISGGEGILRPEATKALGHDWIARTNAAAIAGGVDGVKKRLAGNFMGGFKTGGVVPKKRPTTVWPVPGHDTGTYPGHDGVDINRGSGNTDMGDPIVAFRDGVITYVGSGRGYGDAIFENGPGYPEVVYGHTSAQMVKAGQQVVAGQLIGRVGSTGHSTAAHLHFGIPGGTTSQALALLAGANNLDLLQYGAGAVNDDGHAISLPGWIGKILAGPADWVKGKLTAPIKALEKRFGDSPIIKAVEGVGTKLIGGVGDKIHDMVTGFKDKLTSAAAAAGNWISGVAHGALDTITGGGSVKDDVRSVAKAYGWDKGGEWDALSQVISMESGWDPNADNPSSSAAGLFQKMTSIHGPLEKTVVGQAKWGLDYIANRYGDPERALAFHKSHGYYADGGIVPNGPVSGGPADNGTMMYDNGGYLPPGLTTVLNLTGKPEPVFTSDQFEQMGAGGGSGVHYEPHFHRSDLTSQDVAFDLDAEFRRLSRTSSRYAGKQG